MNTQLKKVIEISFAAIIYSASSVIRIAIEQEKVDKDH